MWESFLENDSVKFYLSLLKIGIYDYETFLELFLYMIPEILIINFIMLNEIKLKLLGMYWANENQIETVHEGIQRNLCGGDEEEILRRKSEQANMCMSTYFKEYDMQKDAFDDIEVEMKQDIRNDLKMKLKEASNNKDNSSSNTMNQQIDKIFKETYKSKNKKDIQNKDMEIIAQKIWKTSR